MESNTLPSHASVIVIGGGVMGCSTLYHLAKQGVSDAILLERNTLTSGTTWHSAAQVRALRSTQNMTNLIRYSIDLYTQLERETGQSTGWINKGSLSIATNAERLTHIKRQESLAHLFGVNAQSISTHSAKERWPLMNADDVLGAVWSPDDGRVSPSDLCSALIKGARTAGAKLFEHSAVLGIITQGEKIKAVETPQGTIRCDAIALCTGLWSKRMAAMAGVDIPVWACEHFYLLTKPVSGLNTNLPTLSDHDSHLYIRDDSGGLLIGCFEPLGKAISPDSLGEDFAFQLLPEDWDHFEPMMKNALHRLPCLETAQVRMLLNGPESFTPDGAFLLGESAQTKGLYLGCGMNSVGVATGGGAGMALAHCIVHGHTPTDLSEVNPSRFPESFNSIKALAARVPEVLGKHYEITFPVRQWTSSRGLVTSPLHQHWLDANAHFGQFYGYERPLYFDKSTEPRLTFNKPDWFEQVGKEVMFAHQQAALFDLSTFGKILVSGADAESFLERLCSNSMSRQPGKVIYTTLLNTRGGIETDLVAMRLDDERYRLYVSTASIKKDMAWLRRHINNKERVSLLDETCRFAVLGFMGPKTSVVANQLGLGELNELNHFTHDKFMIANKPVRAARLSYVGESGWEISCEHEDATDIFKTLSVEAVKPAGLLAQTSMRIEKRFLAYGHELDTDINPLQAGLEFALDFSKAFIGRDALIEEQAKGINKSIVSLVFDNLDAVPIGSEPVYLGDKIIGKTTSASFAYRVGKPLALALISNQDIVQHECVSVDIAGNKHTAKVKLGAVIA